MNTINKRIQAIVHALDAWLWRRGFRLEKVRLVVRTLFLLNALILFVALLAAPLSLSPLSFSLAAILSSYSFFTMAKKIIFNFPVGGAKKVTPSILLNWVLRLTVLLALSLCAIILLKLPPIPWFMGLGLPVVILPMGFLSK